MSFTCPGAPHPNAVELADTELLALRDIVDADEADEQALFEHGVIARLGTIVTVESDEDLFAEEYVSQAAACARFAELVLHMS